MKTLTTLTDPVYVPKAAYNWYDRLWLHALNDKRDLPFIYLLTIIHVVVISSALLLYTPLLRGWLLVAGRCSLFLYFSILFQRPLRPDVALYLPP